MLGDGPLLGSLRQLADSLGIADRLTFRGYVQDPLPFVARAHALVLSSAWEGQGAVLLEAMACGCPVIATRSTAAVAEVLGEGEFGTLVPPHDAQALADAIARQLHERSPVSEQARAWVDRYRVDAGVRSHAKALGLALTAQAAAECPAPSQRSMSAVLSISRQLPRSSSTAETAPRLASKSTISWWKRCSPAGEPMTSSSASP